MKKQDFWGKLEYSGEQKFTHDVDILIIGGGITGITTAYFLKDANKQIMLIDKSKLGMGITSKTTAKINYLQGTVYQTLAKNFGEKISKMYFHSQKDAALLIKDIIKKEDINCSLEKCWSYIFTKENSGIKKIEKEMELLKNWQVECKMVDSLPIHFPIETGLAVNDTYVFQPLKYLEGLVNAISKNIFISEDTTATEITKQDDGTYITYTDRGVVHSKHVVVTCHYPFFIIPGFIPFKTHLEREYVNASKYKHDQNFTAVSIDRNFHSIRFYGDYLIYGSNKHRLTNKIEYANNYFKSMVQFKKFFSKEPEYTWMNQDIITNDNLPLIGLVDKKQPNLLIATGYQAWGMTNGTIAARILADIILDNKNKYISLFDPTRLNMPSIINGIVGGVNYSKVYIQTTVKKNPVFKNDTVYVVKIDGKYYGVYFDYYGKKHIVKHKCPHMKCNLVFNEYEKTWDCPCHGSRFDIDGDVLEGPTTYSIRVDF